MPSQRSAGPIGCSKPISKKIGAFDERAAIRRRRLWLGQHAGDRRRHNRRRGRFHSPCRVLWCHPGRQCRCHLELIRRHHDQDCLFRTRFDRCDPKPDVDPERAELGDRVTIARAVALRRIVWSECERAIGQPRRHPGGRRRGPCCPQLRPAFRGADNRRDSAHRAGWFGESQRHDAATVQTAIGRWRRGLRRPDHLDQERDRCEAAAADHRHGGLRHRQGRDQPRLGHGAGQHDDL